MLLGPVTVMLLGRWLVQMGYRLEDISSATHRRILLHKAQRVHSMVVLPKIQSILERFLLTGVF